MNITYGDPLSRGWDRMKKALFQPFDIGKWFVVGFTAFLAGLLDGGGPKGGNNYSDGRSKYSDHSWEEIAEYPAIAWQWLQDHTLWFTLIIIGLVFIFIILIVFTWLSSRGKFMFLDNVVFDKAEVAKPWYEFKHQGDSLFVWRLVFGFISFILVMASLIISIVIIYNLFIEHSSLSTRIFTYLGLILQFLLITIIISYISLFLNDFVVPIMYKYKVSTSQAWFKFLPILSRHLGHFILYGLFVFVLIILVVVCVIMFGLFTCCIGFILLVLPYISSVVFLPISYTYRAFSIEYLKQFGDDFDVFPQPEENGNEMIEG